MESGKAAVVALNAFVAAANQILPKVTDYQKQTVVENSSKALASNGVLLSSATESFCPALVIPEVRTQMLAVTKAAENANQKLYSALQGASSCGATPKDLQIVGPLSSELSRALNQLIETTECAEAEARVSLVMNYFLTKNRTPVISKKFMEISPMFLAL
jgi:hypothetical protein